MDPAFWHGGYLDLFYTVLEGNPGICKNKDTFPLELVSNSVLRKFRNCTSTVTGVINLGGRSV